MKFLPLACLVLTAIVPFAAQDPAPKPAAQDPTKPAPEHALLQRMVGTFDTVTIVTTPDGVEQRSKGTMTTKRHTDFHTLSDYRGEMMGAEFVGHGVNGWCPVRKQYFTFWTDSMTASPMSMSGTFDAAKNELRMDGTSYGMSGKLEPARTVTKFIDDDRHDWALLAVLPDGKEMPLVRVEYTRRK